MDRRSKGKPNAVQERLDCAMVNQSWMALFPDSSLGNISAPLSDHTSIVLHTKEK